MATQHNSSSDDNGNKVALAIHRSELDPNSLEPARLEIPVDKCEKFETLGCPIEAAVEKISLVGGSQTGVTVQGNSDIINSNEDEPERGSESEESSEESETSSSSSASTSSGSSCSSSDKDDDDDKEEEEEEKGEGHVPHAVDVDFEEGEIRGFDDDNEDADKMASWSMVEDDDDDVDLDDDDGVAARGPIRSKNELEILPAVPPIKVSLESHHQMLPVGVVMSILGAQVIVEGGEKHDPLNEGSILWMTESRKPLGLVDEIFGPVKNPYYIVRYNSENEVPSGIHGGTLVSFVPEFANHVLSNKDLYKKGYDASGANDEELTDEVEFSDDEKEAEYKKMQRMTKRGTNEQNPGKKKNNRKKKVSHKEQVVAVPDAPVASLPNHGNCSPFSGVGQGLFGGTTTVPPFPVPPSNGGPNFVTNGVWAHGTALLQQPQPQPQPQHAMLPNGFPTNGMPWYPQSIQISHQLPLPGNPFQQQLHPSQGPFPIAMLPGMQSNLFAQSVYGQGLVGQNQLTFGLSSPFPQMQPAPSAQQGFPSGELQSEGNLNLHPSTIPGGPPQFHPGASATAGRGRKTFHGAGTKGWRPAK